MTNTSIRWGVAIVATVMAQITMIALSIICVAVYSYAIHTGETPEFYNEFAQTSGPWVSLIAGGPVFYLIARWIRRRASSNAFKTAMTMCALYLAIEIAVLLLWPGDTKSLILLFVIGGFVIKVVGAYAGSKTA